MALPDAGRRLDDEDAGRLAVAPVVTDGGGELVEETDLRRARNGAGGKVGEELGWRCELLRELEAVTYWFQRNGTRIRKTVRWFLMRPLEKEGEHDHEVDEVAWADREEALRRLRYDSDRRLLTTTLVEPR